MANPGGVEIKKNARGCGEWVMTAVGLLAAELALGLVVQKMEIVRELLGVSETLICGEALIAFALLNVVTRGAPVKLISHAVWSYHKIHKGHWE